MSRTIVITSEPVARFSGPPADRMAGRSAARAARVQAQGNYVPGGPAGKAAAEAKAKAAAEARANSFLSRESLLDEAMHQGVIGGGLRAHYGECYDADPEGTRAYLRGLGLRDGGTAAASAAVPSDGYDESRLSPAERTRITAAREGRQPSRIINGGL
jgi:hypothetical protein